MIFVGYIVALIGAVCCGYVVGLPGDQYLAAFLGGLTFSAGTIMMLEEL